MKLTLYLDFYGKDDYDLKKQTKTIVTLPNKDGYHLFEAWMNLSRCESVDYRLVDGTMMELYGIIEEALHDTLGFTLKNHSEGKYSIDDPMVEDEENMSAIISLYLDKRYHES